MNGSKTRAAVAGGPHFHRLAGGYSVKTDSLPSSDLPTFATLTSPFQPHPDASETERQTEDRILALELIEEYTDLEVRGR